MRKCALSLHYFDLLSEAGNDADIPCILGSDTECMTQVFYKWKPHREDW